MECFLYHIVYTFWVFTTYLENIRSSSGTKYLAVKESTQDIYLKIAVCGENMS
jgi:hypothetical protein